RTAVGRGPLVEVHPVDQFAVELDGELRPIAGDDNLVPLAGRLHGVPGRFDQIVEGPGVVIAGRGCVVDGDLDAVIANVLARARYKRIRPDEDPAVAAFADLEVQRQYKVGPGFMVDHHVTAAAVRIDASVLDRHLARVAGAGLPAV